MPHPYTEYRDTALWRALAGALADLEASREVRMETAPHYVIGYLCQELAGKRIVASAALARER
jgi:hypothetical protein